MKLSERLAAIAEFVPPGAKVADIGTDHAYLPIYLVQAGIAVCAVAGDVHIGPFRVAQEAVARAGLTSRIAVRCGNGLTVLSPGETDTVIIAGMGAATIVDILSARPEIVDKLKHIILQPMTGGAQVRRWLAENGWLIDNETLVAEDGRLYEIITAIPGIMPEYESILLEIGPLLWQKRHPLLARHITGLISQLQSVLTEMNKSPAAKASSKYSQLTKKLQQLEAKLLCL